MARRGAGPVAAAVGVALWLALSGPAVADYDTGMAAYEKGDFAAALTHFQADGAAGHAPSQAALGILYARGEGVGKDYAEAAEWFRKAARQGHAKAQHLLGRILFSDALGSRDVPQALEWFEKSAAQNYPPADLALFSIYYRGEDVAKDLERAAGHARRAAEAGLVSAQLQYGYMLLHGEGVQSQPQEAYFWFFLLAQQANADGISMLAQLPEDALTTEERLEAERRALAWQPTTPAQ
jgi:hypothetical protein